MKYIPHFFAGFLATLAGQAKADFGDPMSFYRATSGGNCSSCVWIAAEGVIETDSDEKAWPKNSAWRTSIPKCLSKTASASLNHLNLGIKIGILRK